MQPLIKWTGSKRYLAETIVSYFPQDIDTYYEPFVGGGSVLFELIRSNNTVKKFVVSDKNDSLVGIYNIVKDTPDVLIASYYEHWENLQRDSTYYYHIREAYNTNNNPLLLYFLTRTCFNGTIRYNKNGEFNTAHHFGRPGMHPEKIEKIVNYHSILLNSIDITIEYKPFEDVTPTSSNDVVYSDPPYTNSNGLYFGNIDLDKFQSWVNNLGCSWFINLNGVSGTDNEETITFPYDDKVLLPSGTSAFSRLKKKKVVVHEYFYYHLNTN